MTKSALCLDDVLENSPQTRCLLKLFESDASKLQAYTGRIRGAVSRLLTAQVEIAGSLHQLASVLGEYKDQDFPLDYGQTEFPTVVEKFQRTVTELGSCMDIVSDQLQNCVAYPVDKFVKELEEVGNRREMYHAFDDDLAKATERYAKLHRAKDGGGGQAAAAAKKAEDAGEELCNARRRFHQNGLRYYVQLNHVQYTRRIFLLEPVLSLLYAFRSLFHMGHQALSQQDELTEFFTQTQQQVQSLHGEQQEAENESKEFLHSMGEMERLRPDMYYAEPLAVAAAEEEEQEQSPDWKPPTQKQGYLFMKTKATLMTRWEELYFFTQGGNLMCRGKDDLAGRVLLELTGDVGAGCADGEDRRNTFLITSGGGSGSGAGSSKKRQHQIVLQALSQRDRDQWICVINNLSRDSGTGTGSGNSEGKAAARPDSIPVPSFTAPIQFDLLSPMEDEEAEPELEAEKVGDQADHDDESYKVRFLGCMEVASDRGERVTSDATRQILAARITHNIVLAAEARLVAAAGAHRLLLMEPEPEPEHEDQQAPQAEAGAGTGTKRSKAKAAFNLDDLSYWSASGDNERILALVVRTKGGGPDGRHRFNCYVLESLGERSAKEICDTLGRVTKAAFQAVCKKMATNITPPDTPAVTQE